MQKLALIFCAVAVVAVPFSVCAEEVRGLAKGDKVPAFTVHDVTGPSKGEDLCYRCKFGSQPVVSIFAKAIDGKVAALTKEIDNVVAANADQKMAGFVVVMSDKPESLEGTLEETAKKASLTQMPLTTFKGTAGPRGYKLSSDADVTVMMWVDGKIFANKSFKTGELTAAAIANLVAESKDLVK